METIKGSAILKGLDAILAEEYGINNLTEREQKLFLLGMRMGNVATEYIIHNNVALTGSTTSYNYLKQCVDIYKKDLCFQGKYYWKILKEISKTP